MAGYLADVCNLMLFGGSVCVGFSYDTGTQLAFFKNQPPSQTVDVAATCVIPNVTLWVLESGNCIVWSSDTHARQAQQAQLSTIWSNQLSTATPVAC